jgi:hypothetical protein
VALEHHQYALIIELFATSDPDMETMFPCVELVFLWAAWQRIGDPENCLAGISIPL